MTDNAAISKIAVNNFVQFFGRMKLISCCWAESKTARSVLMRNKTIEPANLVS